MENKIVKGFTQVPNEILDIHLKDLSLPELRVLLVVLRQTVGYVWRTSKQRKYRDWISRSLFIKKASVSAKSVSVAVAGLINKGLLVATDTKGNILEAPEMRKGKRKIYFAYAPIWYEAERKRQVKQLAKKCSIQP